ncbi:MAG: branched-chain amino acid ABC transporter permease [Ilumatobacter sp.]|uniref:branched-chain amino acid ABC transporter permease n=1 Tax=Ilumatobacter sp. TaxID=1967498 RepID=UPI0026049A0C|nr:branched-chain amino acid ABC transporter permease [Ilumatobacter sp.]MDJ0768185.1 branched-chain amino acid ABC transporter permease [Ilumatobacter sp.]
MAATILLASAASTFVQTLVKSLALGSVYVMIALGFVIIFKATQVLNFAAGAISMAGAMFMTILIADGGLPLLPFDNPLAPDAGETPSILLWIVNLVLALAIAALFGLFIERVTIRPMVGQPLFAMAVITLGIEIAIRPFNLDATALEARSLNVPWGAEAWTWGEALIPKSYVAAMIMAAIAGAVVIVFYRSRLGVAMRAVAFDQEAAMAQGINVGRVFAIAWALGAALAALGAIVYGMAPFPPGGQVSQEIHQVLALRVLPVIVLGGLDSASGAVYGGLMIAGAEVFAGEYLSQYNSTLGSGYSTIVPYIVMLIVLLVRPYGLFGTPEVRRV